MCILYTNRHRCNSMYSALLLVVEVLVALQVVPVEVLAVVLLLEVLVAPLEAV